jgi:glycosyltransferase involved in cell wall biosynthesis
MKILFISHSYPPITGGVETQNFEIFNALSKIADCRIIANRKRALIPFFIFYVIVRSLFLMRKNDVLLLGSGLLGIAGWAIKKLTKKPVVAITHGLDLTYDKLFYQRLWVRYFIPSLDRLIAVGRDTKKAGAVRGIPEEKIIFIPNGVDADKFYAYHSRDELTNIIRQDIEGKRILLTLGRLVKRKGVAWFIRNVLPELDQSVIYVIAGDGPDRQNIQLSVSETGQQKRVYMLGHVNNDIRNMLLNVCDIFIQPNIKVSGDIEGFGMSLLEAASCRMPVVASRIEGLQDAVKDGENGFLVEPENPEGFVFKIQELLSNDSFRKSFGEKARQYIVDNYQWKNIARRYSEELNKLLVV